MKTNKIRELLGAGKPTIGCFLSFGSPQVTEMMSHLGFDWLVIEAEHTPLDQADIEHHLMAMNGSDTLPIVRVSEADPIQMQRVLDSGAMGLVVPMIRTVKEAQAVVSATRYPPAGTRGFGPLRAAKYMEDIEDYFRRASENILVSLILETKEAAENIEDIMAVPGVDVIIVGPMDLCLSLGLDPMKQPYPEVDRILERMLAAGKKHNVACGIHVWSPEQLTQRLSEGYTFLSYGTDFMLLKNAVKAGVAAFRQPLAETSRS